jgi:hypothetical protein
MQTGWYQIERSENGKQFTEMVFFNSDYKKWYCLDGNEYSENHFKNAVFIAKNLNILIPNL